MTQYCPLQVISWDCELTVTPPPQENGPILGLPCSSSATFQAMIERMPLRRMPANLRLHADQSVAYFGSLISGPPSVQYISASGCACATLRTNSGVPRYPCHAIDLVTRLPFSSSSSQIARPQRL